MGWNFFSHITHFSWHGFALLSFLSNQCVDIHGKIVRSDDGTPVEGAHVDPFPGFVSSSNQNGVFSGTTLLTPITDIRVAWISTDEDGSLSGTPGKSIVWTGILKNVDKSKFNNRPCDSDPEPTPANSELIIPITYAGTTSYYIGALIEQFYDTPDVVFAAVFIRDKDGNTFRTATDLNTKIVLVAPDGELELAQTTPGYFSKISDLFPNTEYTLKVDIDNNGTTDASSTIVTPEFPLWITPQRGETHNAAGFQLSWTETDDPTV